MQAMGGDTVTGAGRMGVGGRIQLASLGGGRMGQLRIAGGRPPARRWPHHLPFSATAADLPLRQAGGTTRGPGYRGGLARGVSGALPGDSRQQARRPRMRRLMTISQSVLHRPRPHLRAQARSPRPGVATLWYHITRDCIERARCGLPQGGDPPRPLAPCA